MTNGHIQTNVISLAMTRHNSEGRINALQSCKINTKTRAHLSVLVCSGEGLQMLHVNRRHDGIVQHNDKIRSHVNREYRLYNI